MCWNFKAFSLSKGIQETIYAQVTSSQTSPRKLDNCSNKTKLEISILNKYSWQKQTAFEISIKEKIFLERFPRIKKSEVLFFKQNGIQNSKILSQENCKLEPIMGNLMIQWDSISSVSK